MKDEDFTVLGAIIILKGHLSLTDAFKLSNYDIAFLDFPGTLQVFPRSPLVSHMAPHYKSKHFRFVGKDPQFSASIVDNHGCNVGKVCWTRGQFAEALCGRAGELRLRVPRHGE